jgi:hypothetical protein
MLLKGKKKKTTTRHMISPLLLLYISPPLSLPLYPPLLSLSSLHHQPKKKKGLHFRNLSGKAARKQREIDKERFFRSFHYYKPT